MYSISNSRLYTLFNVIHVQNRLRFVNTHLKARDPAAEPAATKWGGGKKRWGPGAKPPEKFLGPRP